MALKKDPNTNYFHWYNANPKDRRTTDCVIRAISTATNMPYYEVLRGLVDMAIETGYHIDDNKCYSKYLESIGWKKHKQPRKDDNTKYTGVEFCQHVADPGERYIAHIGGHHIVAILSCTVWDIWDSTDGTIGNYWVKE